MVTPILLPHSVYAPAPQHTPAAAALTHSVPQQAESDDLLFKLNELPIDHVSLEQINILQESNDMMYL